VVHRRHHGGDHGSDPLALPCSLSKRGGATMVHRTSHGSATAHPMVVHTGHGGAPALLLGLSLGLVGTVLAS
jgi:hypothetical protein